MKVLRKIEHYDKVFHAQELGSYAQGQGSLAVFKVTAWDQGHYKGPSGAFVTYCNISCFSMKMFKFKDNFAYFTKKTLNLKIILLISQ